MKKLLLTLFGAVFLVAATQAQIVTLWDDQAPSGGNMALTSIPDPFGTSHGNIGEYTTTGVGPYSNYGIGGQDWSAYAGKEWTFTFDVYITSTQLSDTNIVDDQYYYSVGGAAGGYTVVSNASWTADAWNTVTYTGTFSGDPNALTNTAVRLLNNDKGTDPVGVNFYLDNFKLVVDTTVKAKIMTINNLDVRPDATFLYGSPVTEGTLAAQPGWTVPTGNVQANPMEIFLRWSGLNLDDAGGADDYIDFTLKLTPKNGPNVTWTGGSFGDNWKMNGTDELTATVTDISVSTNTSGTVAFEGFTSASILAADYADGLYDLSLDINGLTVSAVDTNGTPPNNETVQLPDNSFTNTTLIANNPVYNQPTNGNPVVYLRNFDLMFSWNTNAPPVFLDVIVTNEIEFVSGEGYVDGDINGQQGWVDANTNGNWQVDVAAAGSASTTNNVDNMTLISPIKNLVEGDAVSLTVDFQFLGTPDNLNASTNSVFDGYFMNVGLTASGAGEAIGANQPQAEAVRFQRFFTTGTGATWIRLFKNDWSGPATPSIADMAAGDDLRIVYSLEVGADAGTTFLTATLTNMTQAIGGSSTYAMVTTDTYDALVGTVGAYMYVESGSFAHGTTGISVDRIELIYATQVEVGDGFTDWIADAGLSGSPDADEDYDYDGDGLVNLAEYALNGNPDDINDKGITSMSISGGTMTYSHAALLNDPSVSYILVTSPNLVFGPWTTNTVSGTAPLGGNYEEWSYDVPVDTAAKFIKLIIQK